MIASFKHRLSNKKHTKCRQDNDKAKIVGGEFCEIGAAFPGVVCGILAEGNEACKGCDQRSRAADVDTQKQCGVVGSKLREKHRGGNIADDLAGKNADQEGVFCKEGGEERADLGDACHISRKNEEAEEGGKESVVDLLECFAVKKEQGERNQDQSQLVGDETKDDDNGERKEKKIDCGTLDR